MNEHQHVIVDDVLHKIKQGDVRMKPRIYFVSLAGLTAAAVAASSLAIAYLASIMFYWLRIQTASTMAYGARRNLNEALTTFPWWAVIVAVGITALAVVLVRKQGTMYRHKASTVALSIVGLSLIVGLLLYAVGIGGVTGPNGVKQGGARQGQGRHQSQ